MTRRLLAIGATVLAAGLGALPAAGLRVMAIDFRGYGQSRAGSLSLDGRHLDVLAAVDALRYAGATTVSVIGASMGGDYAADGQS